MPLSPGSKLGPYDIVSLLGKGGMGEVWRARDPRLDRNVAIKISAQQFSDRFEREARAIAALNHPHICTLYDVGPDYLVMEYVEGAELKGPLPLPKAIDLASQILDALAAAHRKGIVHRDLKPANILVTKTGVKVLDFGLAKMQHAGSSPGDAPTVLTTEGTIAGTLYYMAPEQLNGIEADARADIFAFGCVFYEMLTGKRAFEGKSNASVIAAVMERPAPSAGEVAPEMLDRVLKRCLEKDREERWQSALDLKVSLNMSVGSVAPRPQQTGLYQKWPLLAVVLTSVAATAGVAAFVFHRGPAPIAQPMKLSVDLGAEVSPASGAGEGPTLAISPDGARIALVSHGANGKDQLFLKTLANSQLTALAGTGGAASPFFSPDSKWIAFFADSKLKKVSIDGGEPLTLANARNPRGGFWGEDDNILFAPENRVALLRIPSSGGSPQAATQLDLKKGEVSNRYPQLLPGGKAILFTTRTAQESWEDGSVSVQVLKTGEHKTLVHGGYFGRYLPSGYLLYVHQSTLYSAPMDMGHLELTGAPSPVIENLKGFDGNGWAYLSFAQNGTLVYLAEASGGQQLPFLLGASGSLERVPATPGRYSYLQSSPDGTRLAWISADGAGSDLSLYDLGLKRQSKIAEFKEPVQSVHWAPDGKHLTFYSSGNQLSGPGVYWMRADGGGEPQRLIQGPDWISVSFSNDGKLLGYYHRVQPYGLWALPLDMRDPEHPVPGRPESLYQAAFDVRGPTFSPDGRWISYRSNESGRTETYVRAIRGSGQWRISQDGGGWAVWSLRRQELVYPTPDNAYVVEYKSAGDSFVPGEPRVWSDKLSWSITNFGGLMPDGAHLAVLLPADTSALATRNTQAVFLMSFFPSLRH